MKDACAGLDALELLDRGRHIARALAKRLPPSYPDAIAVLLQSLGPEHASDELIGAGMAPFFYLPHTVFVAEHGLDHFDVSMRAQYELTKRFSAESSIRPYIAKYPERTLDCLRGWARDPNAHVRRLVSEGTRLRLPWSQRVPWLDQHPERVLALLEMLKDDDASMVRRSVANNLNDLGKVHPGLLMQTCESWLEDASPERRELVEHALRSAVRRAVPEALRLLGYGGKASVAVEDVRIVPRRVSIGKQGLRQFQAAQPVADRPGRPGGPGGAFRESERPCHAEGVQVEARRAAGAAARWNSPLQYRSPCTLPVSHSLAATP